MKIPARELGFKNEAERDSCILKFAENYIESLKSRIKKLEFELKVAKGVIK